MSDLSQSKYFSEMEVLDAEEDIPEFFAPTTSDVVDSLIGQYQSMRSRIEHVACIMIGPEANGTLHYFSQAASVRQRDWHRVSLDRFFDKDAAIAALDASYWSKAMQLTDVLDAMPQARRDTWNKSITEHKTPAFEEETVRATFKDLLSQRERFFAERVDGIFQGLSGEHVTNAPEAFGRRMILSRVVNDWGSPSYSTVGLINDLRAVIAKFMGRTEPGYGATEPVIRSLWDRTGEWVSVDGGALHIRLYKKGTAHLMVHPEVAWRLNCILAQLYPLAIPAEFRKRPTKKTKEFVMHGRPLPFKVLTALAEAKTDRVVINDKIQYIVTLRYGSSSESESIRAEARQVLASLGATQHGRDRDAYLFTFAPREILQEVIANGCIPDVQAHQFYPTPQKIAKLAVEIADIKDHEAVLEPSAGVGGIADFLPKDRTQCIEISKLHADVLGAKGYSVLCADFLNWKSDIRFDKIVMNPPFSDGRWLAHVQAAGELLRKGGALVAVLPASAKGKELIAGLQHEYSAIYKNEFAGTTVDVVLVKIVR